MESTLNNNIDSMFNTIDEFVGISKEAKLIRKIVDIRTWLSEEYYSGPASYQIYPYWKNAIIKVFTSPVRINEVILGGCFVGDTKVPLLDGTVRTMKELAEEYGLEKTFWVYSVDNEGNVVPGKAKNARKTGVNREVWKITLDNGQELYCTPDHKFLTADLRYIQAKDLTPDISLYPSYYKQVDKNVKAISVEFSHYEDVYDIEVEEYHNFMLHNACVVHNSIGTGKTTIACYMIAYKLYELSCYYPPQALYNLMNNSKILFAYFNINKEVAGQVGFSQIRDLIDTIPYFQNIFKRNEKINSILEWPQSRIYMKSASSSNDVLGMNLISFFVDEANFFKGDGVSNKGTSVNDIQSKARILYNSVRTRGKSRFVVNNEDFTFNVLVSSSMYDSSFTAERIQASAGDPHVMVFEPKIWEVKNVDTYSKERFVVFSGNELIDPVICNSVADINYIRMHYRLPEVKCDNPRDAIKDIKEYDVRKRFIEVPMNFRKEFEGNIIQALQDIAGVPVSATGKLFSNRDSYSKALTSEESPFTQDQIVVSTNANTTIQDYFKPGWKPKDPNKKRFLHFDQSTSGDSTGIAQCYIDKVIYDEFGLPKVVINFDWMIRINPPKPPHKIDIAKLRSIIPWQEKVFGISYGMISYDTFQSAEAVQDLEKSGYNVQFRSVEKDKPYLDLTDLYYQGRIHHYRNEWYEKELFNLNWYRAQGRVDHPSAKEGGCLRGNTKIKMLNGTDIEIKDLIGKDDFWLYGCNPDGTIVPTKGRNCHITKYVDKLYRITLDNGKVIETTDNHKFMLRDGLYARADELEVGQSLMPLYVKDGSYEQILNNKTGRWNFTHIYVYRWFNNDYDRLKVIHHYDINSKNNEPNNLKQLTRSEHMRVHKDILCKLSVESRRNNEEFKNKQRKSQYLRVYGRNYKVLDITFKDYKPIKADDEKLYKLRKERYLRKKAHTQYLKNVKYHGFSDYNKSQEAILRSKTNAKKLNEIYWNKPENKEWQRTVGKQNLRKALDKRINKEDNVWIEKVLNSKIDYKDFTICEFMNEFGGSYNAVKRRVAKINGVYNHKVKDIEIIYLDKPEPVYDITVDETSNFALTDGIFVHNSKDLADAVCGSVANALEYPIVEEMQRENDIDFFLEDSKGYSYMSDKDELLNGFNFIN